MKNYNHPNVLPLYCSFVTGQDLWMVMPYISGGSVLHIMKYAYPEVCVCVPVCVRVRVRNCARLRACVSDASGPAQT